jgi:gluconokinase
MIVLVMGVAGVGKTTIGEALAHALSARFIDADDYHPPENVAKMKAGIPLEDVDRWPWLSRLNKELKQAEHAVLACSALKASYRERLSQGIANFTTVYLHGSFELIRSRMESRRHRYMPAALLESQCARRRVRGGNPGAAARGLVRFVQGGAVLRHPRHQHLKLDGPHHRCCGAVHLQLPIGVLDVARHGVRRDPELRGDFGVGATARQQAHDVSFAQGQHGVS